MVLLLPSSSIQQQLKILNILFYQTVYLTSVHFCVAKWIPSKLTPKEYMYLPACGLSHFSRCYKTKVYKVTLHICKQCCSNRYIKVRAALNKMKRHKAPGLSGLVTEMIQATGDTQWILDLCNGIVKEGSIPEDWKWSVVLPIYKGKGDPMECGSYRGIKLLEHAMKVVGRIFEHRIRQQIKIDDMQFGF